MNYFEYSKRLAYLKEMLEKEQVCSPGEAGERFQCSEKTVRNMINCLREQGLEIKYCRQSRRYILIQDEE